MDTITQGLLGAVTAQLGFRQRIGRGATWAAAAAAVLPDLDIFVVPVLELTGIETDAMARHRYHRGLSHSLLMVPVLAAGVAVAWWALRRRGLARVVAGPDGRLDARAAAGRAVGGQRSPPGFGWLYACCLVAVLTHPLLDWCTSYGTQMLAPITDRRFAADVVPIIDIFYTPLLVLTLLLCWVVRKVKTDPRRATLIVGWTGFLLSVGYLTAGRVMHDLAVARARELVAPGRRIVRADAYPSIGTIFLWRGVVETEDAWLAARIRPIGGRPPRHNRARKVDNAWVRRAAGLPAAGAFRWFAMGRTRPTYEKLDGRHVVEFHDMRYGLAAEDVESLWSLRVIFDADGSVREVARTRRHRRRELGGLIKRVWKDMWAP